MITVPKRRRIVRPTDASQLTYRYEFPFLFDRIVELHTKRDPEQDPEPPPDPGGPPPAPPPCVSSWDSSVLVDRLGQPIGIPGYLYYDGDLWINPPQCCPPAFLDADGNPILFPDGVEGVFIDGSGSSALIAGGNAKSLTLTFSGPLDGVAKWPRTCPSQTHTYDPEIWGAVVTVSIDELALPEHEAHQGCGTTIEPFGTKRTEGSVLVEFDCPE
jgi:hypothetical protein